MLSHVVAMLCALKEAGKVNQLGHRAYLMHD